MDLNDYRITPPLKAFNRARYPRPELQPLNLSRTPSSSALNPLDLSPRDGHPLKATASLADLNARSTGAGKDLRREAEIFVSQAFFGTLLKQMRESPFRSDLFEGGRGGQAFGSLYDQHLAERMARGAGTKLVNTIVRKLEAKRAYAKDLRNARLRQSGRSAFDATAS